MRLIFLFVSLISTSIIVNSQAISDMSFGTDSTFELITWNIENYPKNTETTSDYVKQVILALDADIYAVQEIKDYSAFDLMISELSDYGSYKPNVSYHDLAFIYKKSTVTVNSAFELPYDRVYTSRPYALDLTYDNKNIIIINTHLKARGNDNLDMYNSNDEEYRRYKSNQLIIDYIKSFQSDKCVAVVGDMNDKITDDESYNVFQPILDEPKNFKFADWNIAVDSSSNWSYPSPYYTPYTGHIDHIWITNELFDELIEPVAVVQTLKVDEYMSSWNSYDDNISDHRPVGMKIVPNNFVAINETNQQTVSFSNFPNPFISSTEFVFDKIEQNTELFIYNSIGEIVFKQSLSKGQNNLVWSSNNLPTGIYIAQLLSNSKLILKTTLIKN